MVFGDQTFSNVCNPFGILAAISLNVHIAITLQTNRCTLRKPIVSPAHLHVLLCVPEKQPCLVVVLLVCHSGGLLPHLNCSFLEFCWEFEK